MSGALSKANADRRGCGAAIPAFLVRGECTVDIVCGSGSSQIACQASFQDCLADQIFATDTDIA